MADIKERMKNVIRRLYAARRSVESLRFQVSKEHRNPDPKGVDLPVSGPDGNPVRPNFDQVI